MGFFDGITFGSVLGTAGDYLAQKDAAKDAAKARALEAQRAFELEKIRAQAAASQPASYPGAPAQMQGGTGLAPGVPLWWLLGAGAGLLVVALVLRK